MVSFRQIGSRQGENGVIPDVFFRTRWGLSLRDGSLIDLGSNLASITYKLCD